MTINYQEACATCSGHGTLTLPSTWTVDSTDRRWSRKYTEHVNIQCDDCEGSGYFDKEE